MNLSELFELQGQLEEKIIREKGLEGQDLLKDLVLALQTEICEMANEWRGFKVWSNDREPRREKMLEEYADALHFFLSIARVLGLSVDDLYVIDDVLEGDTSVLFTELLYNIGMINGHLFLVKKPENIREHQRSFFRSAFGIFCLFGEQRFGFTWEQICEAYVKKNKVNLERQAQGY